MLLFDGLGPVPGACWVEIADITNKDGSPLAEGNWRRERIGRISLCWIAGGFRERSAFFFGKLRKVDGKMTVVSLTRGWCSTTSAQPVEAEPDVFLFETNTSIYRFRILAEDEAHQADAALYEAVKEEESARQALFQHLFSQFSPNATGGVPAS